MTENRRHYSRIRFQASATLSLADGEIIEREHLTEMADDLLAAASRDGLPENAFRIDSPVASHATAVVLPRPDAP